MRIATIAIFMGLFLTAIVLAGANFAYAIQLALEGWWPTVKR